MIKERIFIEKWESVRKQGRNKYLLTLTVPIFIVILGLFVIKDFIAHELVFSGEKLLDIVFKNFFIVFIIAFLLSLFQWFRNEKKYMKIKKTQSGKESLRVEQIKGRF